GPRRRRPGLPCPEVRPVRNRLEGDEPRRSRARRRARRRGARGRRHRRRPDDRVPWPTLRRLCDRHHARTRTLSAALVRGAGGALHFDVSTPNFMIQEAFADFDVPWRNALVRGWNPIENGAFVMNDQPGLGLELDEAVIAEHPYVKNAFPSLWDERWTSDFAQ